MEKSKFICFGNFWTRRGTPDASCSGIINLHLTLYLLYFCKTGVRKCTYSGTPSSFFNVNVKAPVPSIGEPSKVIIPVSWSNSAIRTLSPVIPPKSSAVLPDTINCCPINFWSVRSTNCNLLSFIIETFTVFSSPILFAVTYVNPLEPSSGVPNWSSL